MDTLYYVLNIYVLVLTTKNAGATSNFGLKY